MGAGFAELHYEIPRPQWTEQDPRLWWEGTIAAVKRVLDDTGVAPYAVIALGFGVLLACIHIVLGTAWSADLVISRGHGELAEGKDSHLGSTALAHDLKANPRGRVQPQAGRANLGLIRAIENGTCARIEEDTGRWRKVLGHFASHADRCAQ